MKSQQTCNPSPHPRQPFLEWYNASATGQTLYNLEASYLRNQLQLTYKRTIVQVGHLGLERSFAPDEFRDQFVLIAADSTGFCGPRQVTARYAELPLASDSVDALILPHTLEFDPNPHALLQEIDRVLKPEAELFIFGFNPWSPENMARYWPRRDGLWYRHAIACHRIFEWLNLLKFETEFAAGFSLWTSATILRPQKLLDQSRAYLAPVYAIRAIKRTYTMIPIKPAWLQAPGLIPGHIVDTPVLRKN